MQYKLDKNAHKKGWPTKTGKRGWKQPHCDINFLLDKLDEEVSELRLAILVLKGAKSRGIDPSEYMNNVKLEASDVGNIVMMIADNLECLENSKC